MCWRRNKRCVLDNNKLYDDNKFLECAIASGAEIIVTGDKHLLALKIYQNIQILKPNEFIAYLML